MKQKNYRLLTLLLGIAMMLALVAACSGGGNSPNAETPTGDTSTGESSGSSGSSGSSASSDNPPPTGGLIAEPGTVTLKVAIPEIYPSPYNYSNNLPVWQEVEKRTGVSVEWEDLPLDQYPNAMNLRIASGANNLPDILNVPVGANITELGSNGVLLPLEDLIEQHAPNMQRYFADNPHIKSLMMSPEGHIYSIPSVVEGSLVINPYVVFIRQDWLDQLGLSAPQTPDEFYTVLKAFKANDMNGNGKADEIPLVVQGPTANRLLKLGEPWGLRLFYSQGFSVDASGNVQYDYMNPRMKEFLAWLNKLYSEGLIDPEFTTNDTERMVAKFSSNNVGSGFLFLSGTQGSNTTLRAAGFAEANIVALVPMKGPYGDQFQEKGGSLTWNWSISGASDKAVEAIKWLDYIWASEEGNDLMLYGIEGESYVVKDGVKQYTESILNNPDGLAALQALRYLGAWPNLPYVQTLEAYQALNVNNPEILEASSQIEPFLTASFPNVVASAEETATLQGVMPELQTYLDEMILKFVVGQESLDRFDAFVDRIGQFGIDKVLQVKQAQWDRFNNN